MCKYLRQFYHKWRKVEMEKKFLYHLNWLNSDTSSLCSVFVSLDELNCSLNEVDPMSLNSHHAGTVRLLVFANLVSVQKYWIIIWIRRSQRLQSRASFHVLVSFLSGRCLFSNPLSKTGWEGVLAWVYECIAGCRIRKGSLGSLRICTKFMYPWPRTRCL